MTTQSKKKLVKDLRHYYKALNVKLLYEKPDHKFTNEWLAETASILRLLDRGDYRSFMDLRQHIYSSINIITRKHAAEQIRGLIGLTIAKYSRDDIPKQTSPTTAYIRQEIIEGFIKRQDEFDYKKLLRLIGELNSNFVAGYPYSSSMLIRAILDHIPPLLGFVSFEEVVNNYPWSQTDKKYMERLFDFKNEGDDALHRQISGDTDLLRIEDIPNSVRLNRLLQECLKISEKYRPTTAANPSLSIQQKDKEKGIDIRIQEGTQVSWANYAQRHGVYSCFRIFLEVDNFKSKSPDFVTVSLLGNISDGSQWVGNHFIFQGIDKQDESLKIEAQDIKRVTVFVSDYLVGSSATPKSMPLIDNEGLKLLITTKSGKNFEIPIAIDKITKG